MCNCPLCQNNQTLEKLRPMMSASQAQALEGLLDVHLDVLADKAYLRSIVYAQLPRAQAIIDHRRAKLAEREPVGEKPVNEISRRISLLERFQGQAPAVIDFVEALDSVICEDEAMCQYFHELVDGTWPDADAILTVLRGQASQPELVAA